MEKFREVFTESMMTDGFEEAVEKVAKKLGFKKVEDNLYHNSNEESIFIIDDEYERSIIINISDANKTKLNKAIKNILKKYNGSYNSISGGTEYNFYDKD